MSPAPLCQGVTDFESDSDHLSTPVDPPASCQPYVAEYAPLQDSYYDRYEGVEYVPGHPAQLARSADSEYLVETTQSGLLLRAPYQVPATVGCSQPADNQLVYSLVASNRHSTSPSDLEPVAHITRTGLDNTRDAISLPLAHSKSADSTRAQHSSFRTHYPEYDAEYVDKAGYVPMYGKPGVHQFNLTCDTNPSYPSPDLPLHGSYSTINPHNFSTSASYVPQPYYDDGNTDSPIEDTGYGDRYPSEGCVYEQQTGYEHYQPHPQPHLGTHYAAGPGRSQQHNVHFHQPSSCPYSYPRFDTPRQGSYGTSPVSPSFGYSVIHAPRPQQVTDLLTLNNGTGHHMDDSSMLPTHRILSIPSLPAPPPVTRPSSLIEDSPKKPLTLACFFCRKRKIACQSPSANSSDRTCNQCSKRKLKCVYPATSRRGIRPRLYDLADETSFRRPSVLVGL